MADTTAREVLADLITQQNVLKEDIYGPEFSARTLSPIEIVQFYNRMVDFDHAVIEYDRKWNHTPGYNDEEQEKNRLLLVSTKTKVDLMRLLIDWGDKFSESPDENSNEPSWEKLLADQVRRSKIEGDPDRFFYPITKMIL